MKEILLEAAKTIRQKAYSPYSKFKVGAALLAESGAIYIGCNIENASYSLTCCAERVALFDAIKSGERAFTAMAIVADTPGPISPCGACRQVMSEFFKKETTIYLANLEGEEITMTMEVLLPFSFEATDFVKDKGPQID